MTQNLASPFNVDGLTFNAGAPAYTVNGGPIAIQDNPNTTQGVVVQNSSLPVTFNTPLQLLSNEVFFQGNGSGVVTVAGVVSGAIYKQSTGTLVLTNSGNTVYDAEVVAGTLKITSPTAINNMQVDAGGVFQIGFVSGNNSGTPVGNITLYNGTMAVSSGSAGYYVNTMTGTGTIDFTGSSNFGLHFTNGSSSPLISIGTDLRNPLGGSFTWIGSGSSHIQNDATVPLNIQIGSGDSLTCGIILANGTTSQPMYVNDGGTLVLTNTGNTANLIIDYATKLQIANLACLGSGSITLEGAPGLGQATNGAIVYTGPTATLSKNLTLAYSNGALFQLGGGVISATQDGTILTVSGTISEAFTGQVLGITGSGTSASNTIVTLTGTNTYTGPTMVFGGGILAVNSITNGGVAGPLGAANNLPSNVYLGLSGAGPGTLLYQGANASTDRGITFSSSASDPGFVQVGSGINLTFTGQMANGMLNKNGLGTLTLAATNNTFAGANVFAGTLAISNAVAMGTGSSTGGATVNVMAGGTFQLAFPTGNNFFTPLGTLNLNGGTFNAPNESVDYFVDQITSQAGGVIDLSTATVAGIRLTGNTPAIGVTASATWLGNVNTRIVNDTFVTAPIAISPGATLTNGIPLLIGSSSQGFQVTGGGTLNVTAVASAPLTVTNSTLQTATIANLQSASTLSLDGGAILYTGPSGTLNRPINVTANGAVVNVSSATTALQIGGTATGTGLLDKEGPGTLALGGAGGFTGNVLVNTGVLQLFGSLGGSVAITVNAGGNLQYGASQTTGRTFNLNYGTLSSTAGIMVNLSAAIVNGGFMRGPGTFALTGGTDLNGVAIQSSAVINQTGAASLNNVSNGGQLTVGSGVTLPMVGVINEGGGSITVSATGAVNVTDLQTYGTVTINPATVTETFANTTLVSNVGTSPLYFNGGSRTFIGTPATAVFPPSSPQHGQPTFVAGIDLNSKNAVVAGGLFVNNGYVEDSSNNFQGTATIVADFGSLVKGAGYFQNTVQTINGGKFQAGNSPGSATFGKFVLGPGGVSNYVFAIDDATGAAGPSPDEAGHVSGWGLVKVGAPTIIDRGLSRQADFTWTATPWDKVTVALQTLLNPTIVGVDVPGMMDHFDPSLPYKWPAVEWTGSYAGPADAAMLGASTSFDLSDFANPVGGTFGWSLDQTDHALSLTYTPSAVPEPRTLGMTVLAGLTFGCAACRRVGRVFHRPIAC
jgi:autotransporter-associated beta strand protein